MNSSYSSELEDTPENRKKIFYKQKLIEGYDEERDITFDQTLIVTYSLKYKLYQQTVRNRQIERAKKYLEHPSESDRWEIEESFRIMKSEFDARPVYLQRDDRIKSHFLTCFISLMIYRILEKQLNEKFTCEDLINTLQEMNMRKIGVHGCIPCYTRTSITDALHENAGFRTDYEILSQKVAAGIIRRSKGL